MRKFIFALAMMVALAFLPSCNSCTNNGEGFGIQYALESNGTTDGFVQVAFVNGGFKVTGDASYDFNWSNETPALQKANNVVVLSEALKCGDIKTVQAAEYVNNWLEESIKVTDFSGHYDIYVKGYVMETMTQIKFSIDRHFTNIPE